MVQSFPFAGILNTDDPDEVIPSIHHRDARNIVWRGTQPNLRAENIPGTIEKTNPFLINDGANLTIGRMYDPISKRIYFFNYRSDNNKAIYMYDTILGIFYRLVAQGVNAENDVLGFTAFGNISNIDIIYGDSSQGDILCFIDSLGIPKKVNIQRALGGGYGIIKKSYLDIAKEPPQIPPYCIYENDTSNTVNNLRKKLFKFKIRWVFDDKDKSVTSSQGSMPLPVAPFDQGVDADATKNCRIAITYQTGPANVKKIEILGALSLGNIFSDFFLISSIDKSVSGLSDNDIATYLFYNNQAYDYITVEESNQLFDYVPQTAGTQTLLNGNVITYGNIREGYQNLTNFSQGSLNSNVSSTSVPYYYGTTFSNLIASQNGNSAFGADNIHIIVRGIILSPSFSHDTYTVYFTNGTNISYTLNTNDDAAAIIEGLRVDALSKGFLIVSVGSNDLIIYQLGSSLARTYISSNYAYAQLLNGSLFAYDWSSRHGFALVYYDDKGRTNGAVYTDGFSVTSDAFTEVSATTPNKPKFIGTIYHQPPDWAYYFQWIRTKDLSKSKIQQWISDRTFKDTVSVSGIVKYAYVSIESLNVFVKNNPGSPLGYSFLAGDRIKFIKRYNADGTTANIYGNTKDYEIVGTLTDPTINGEVKLGQFVKLVLPSTDGSFDFGTSAFNNYFIELYTTAQSVANGLNVYYEFGERYVIGNPTLSTRFHQGKTQNQNINTTTPALYEFFEGDYYVRLRSVQTGNIYLYNVQAGSINAVRILIGLTFVGSTYNDPNVTTQSVALQPLQSNFNPSGDNRWFLAATGVTDFKISGSISITFPTAVLGQSWRVYTRNLYNDFLELVPPFDASNAGTYTFTINSQITLENDRIYLIFEPIPYPTFNQIPRQMTVNATSLSFTIDHVISQPMIDQNFSDYFPSAVNSNGRALVYEPDADQTTFPVMYRWSLAYQSDTDINQANRFYPQNLDSVDRRFGAIRRMKTWDRLLTFFQERKCGQTGVYQKFITDSGGSQQLITTDSIITENNVQYYAGDFGVGNQPDSVVQSGYVYYFVDPIKGKQLRLSRDGIIDLSEIYKTQTWAGINISKYLTNRTYTFGGIARITGTFNIRKDNTGEYLCVLQPYSGYTGETIAFDEPRNIFSSFYDFAPEQILCAENILYSWVNGKMYTHNNTATYNTFYGVYHDSFITRVFNAALVEKKSWMSLTEISSDIWDCPDIYTNQMSYGNTPQRSNLITQDFVQLESTFSASFLGDINSQNGIINGDTLKGNLIVIKFRAPNATNLVTLSNINLYFIDSPFTNK